MTYQELKKLIESKGLKFFDNGRFNLNTIYIRTSNLFTDKYTDKLCIAYRDGNLQECILEMPCSTKAGSFYVKNPLVVMGIKGTAVMVDGYQYQYQFINNNSWLNTPYLKQAVPIKVWRDGVIDGDIDEVNLQEGQFGVNCHTAGSVAGIVFNWSAGCLVTPQEHWAKAIALFQKSLSLYGDRVTITLIRGY